MEIYSYDECTWSDMEVAISGVDATTKVRGVTYSVESDDEALHGGGDKPISIQSGNKTYRGSFRFLKGTLDDLQVAAKAVGARDVTDLRFTVTVTYQESDNRPLQTDTLVGCKISKWEKSWMQGAKYMDIDIPINFLDLLTIP
jgi:hypothetical protein